jgi:hypothetical protein
VPALAERHRLLGRPHRTAPAGVHGVLRAGCDNEQPPSISRRASRALLLPIAGSGNLAFADAVEAAAIPMMTSAPLPFSAERLQLRSIKRALAALPTKGDVGFFGQKGLWYRMMTEEYAPIKMRVSTRPVRS